MSNHFLIYPCVFNDQEYETLRTEFENCTNYLLKLNEITYLKPKFDAIRFPMLLLDFSEVLRYRNKRGYKFNSYILNMLILKIEYQITLLEKDDNLWITEIVHEMKETARKLTEILISKQDEPEEFTVG